MPFRDVHMWSAEVNLLKHMTLGEDLTHFTDLLHLPEGTKVTITKWNDDKHYLMWHHTGKYIIEKGYVNPETLKVISYT